MIASHPLLVVTPTLGKSAWLDRTMASVAAHAGARALHVLVAPLETHADLQRRFPHCELVADTVKRGVYPAINLGLKHMWNREWQWFTWINDDDEFTAGFAAHLDRTLVHDGRHFNSPWTYGRVRLHDGRNEDLGGLAVARWSSAIVPLVQSGINPLNQQGLLAPRIWVEWLRGLREDFRICADLDFWLRAVKAGANFRCSPQLVAIFRLRAGQISGDVARHQSEFQQIVQALDLPACGPLRRITARATFRLGNAAVYAGRLRRSGWRSGYALLQQPARKNS